LWGAGLPSADERFYAVLLGEPLRDSGLIQPAALTALQSREGIVFGWYPFQTERTIRAV
jgi:hypothetical protein